VQRSRKKKKTEREKEKKRKRKKNREIRKNSRGCRQKEDPFSLHLFYRTRDPNNREFSFL